MDIGIAISLGAWDTSIERDMVGVNMDIGIHSTVEKPAPTLEVQGTTIWSCGQDLCFW